MFLLIILVFLQIAYLLLLSLLYGEAKIKGDPTAGYFFRHHAVMPWVQLWRFLFGDQFHPSFPRRISATFRITWDELYIRADEFHPSLESNLFAVSESLTPFLWVYFYWKKCTVPLSRTKWKQESSKRYTQKEVPFESLNQYKETRYFQRLRVRREIAHETDNAKGWGRFFLRQRTWYAYRFSGERSYRKYLYANNK